MNTDELSTKNETEALNKHNVRRSSLLAINFAFQNTIEWGGTWKLTEKDLKEIRNLIDPNDVEKTGANVWGWFYNKWNKKFYTSHSMKYIGSEFMRHFSRYCA